MVYPLVFAIVGIVLDWIEFVLSFEDHLMLILFTNTLGKLLVSALKMFKVFI
jgi:hypothetical protein